MLYHADRVHFSSVNCMYELLAAPLRQGLEGCSSRLGTSNTDLNGRGDGFEAQGLVAEELNDSAVHEATAMCERAFFGKGRTCENMTKLEDMEQTQEQ